MEQIPRIHFEYTTLAADNNYPEFEVHVVRGQQVRQGHFFKTCKPSRWDAPTCKQVLLWVTHANGKRWAGEWSNPAGRSVVRRTFSMRRCVMVHTGSLERTKESLTITQLRATLSFLRSLQTSQVCCNSTNYHYIVSFASENTCKFPSQSEIHFAHATRVDVCLCVCTVNLILRLY